MPIDLTNLKKALAPAADLEKRERVELDLGKVCGTLIGEMSQITKMEDGDPEEAIDSLFDTVNDLDTLLGKCEETEDGVFADTTVDDEVAKRFRVEEKPEGTPEPAPGKTKKGETEDEDEPETDADLDLTDDLSEDDWGKDLAPANRRPESRKEALTKNEVPISSRRGDGRKRAEIEKHERARDRAMGRGEPRATK